MEKLGQEPAAQLAAIQSELVSVRGALEDCERGAQQQHARAALARREMQRRQRNTLALVRSIFTRTVETGESLEEVADHFRGRLDVLARYQQPGASVGDSRVDLASLICDEFRDFRFGSEPGITIDGPDVTLGPDQALPVALAVHELVTNALKFGALARESGRVSVTWTVTHDRLTLVWSEAGVPILQLAPPRRGFGREYIEEALPYQIGAAAHFDLKPGGVLCRLEIPLDSP